jgi:hypothetical protein
VQAADLAAVPQRANLGTTPTSNSGQMHLKHWPQEAASFHQANKHGQMQLCGRCSFTFRHVCADAISLQVTVHVHVQDTCSRSGLMFMSISRLSHGLMSTFRVARRMNLL